MTPRPRSRDKVVPVSIGIPVSLMMRLDNELDWRQSRSKWVKSAILQKLDEQFDWTAVSSKRLLAILLNRSVIDYDRFKLLCQQVEETEEGQ
ncbi:unnamed protein product [marine sediment metagenome]|uniref:Ribbon-helix-helix protein CopG domain-containing protein n=1 Tax=marine sediment metagenome TaxID=412755 RepID=X0YUZ6_9ZZZZ